MSDKKERRRIDDLMKADKGVLKCSGYSIIKRTYIDETGNEAVEEIEIPIRGTTGHEAFEEFKKNFAAPEAPKVREYINRRTGEKTDYKDSDRELRQIHDMADKDFLEKRDNYLKDINNVAIMVALNLTKFDRKDGFEITREGLDKFSEFLKEKGFEANHITQIISDINALDTFEKK